MNVYNKYLLETFFVFNNNIFFLGKRADDNYLRKKQTFLITLQL